MFRDRGHDPSLVADEGGLAARLPSNRAALELLVEGIERSGLAAGAEVGDRGRRRRDAAARRRPLRARERGPQPHAPTELVDEIAGWVDDYPIVSIEDAPARTTRRAGGYATAQRLGASVQLLGDDLFVTSPERLTAGIADGIANAVLVKPNQIGTLTRRRSRSSASRRTQRLRDRALGPLRARPRTAGSQTSRSAGAPGQIKVGSTTRSERTAKWNRLLRIESEVADATFAGRSALHDGDTSP